MKWFENMGYNWIGSEINKIQQTSNVSADEAKTILEQRLLEFAKRNGISKEEATAIYGNLQTNQSTIHLKRK